VRDFLLNEALKRLAADAAVRLSALVAGGEQIPFDVAEEEGPDSAFHMYEPLTSRFVREREEELRALPSFTPARDAVDASGVAAAYLERCGETVPADPRERASTMLTVFLASLWDGCTEFSLDRQRLDEALGVLDAESRDADDADVLIAPVVGLKMAPPALQLPHGVRLIRADAIEAPIEAMRSEGMGRASWEPQYLAVAEQHDGPDSAAEALQQLLELVSVMRLFKAGGIGLGPYAFAPTGSGQWSRIPTGAPATRRGGYLLSQEDAERLVDLAVTLEARPDPDGALSWAVARFEMGCARESALDGLSDHLLALRAVLEGQGPVGASLPMRAAALISNADGSCDRIEARSRVERALELERSLMNGTAPGDGLELAAWVEDGARRMLRDAALGELGADLNSAADETLIATGLMGGDVDTSVSVADSPARFEPEAKDLPSHGESPSPSHDDRHLSLSEEGEGPSHSANTQEEDPVEHDDQETRIMEPVPSEDEIRIHAPLAEEPEPLFEEPVPGEDEIRITATNWLDEVSVEEGTMEWTAGQGEGIGSRERLDSPRVRHLFPVPEDADWEVRELKYDHYRNAG
jgi:hypothetical protein